MQAELIENIRELIENINTLKVYLNSKKDPEYSFALDLIKRGICFIKYEDGFYPSRFIGYKENTMDKHESNEQKDGRITNPRIISILGDKKPQLNAVLDKEYRTFCESLGFEAREKGPFAAERKFWEL